MRLETMGGPMILETNARGELQIPAEALGAGPQARYRLEHDGSVLRLIPEVSHPLWETLPGAERGRTFREWVSGLPKRRGPGAS